MRRPYSLRRAEGDDGVVIVLVALAMVAMLIIAAIVIDVGFVRGGSRFDQKAADLAALAGGNNLGAGNYDGACQDIIRYLNTNAPDMPAITPATFCHQPGRDVTTTTCSGGSLSQAAPTTTAGRYTIELHFPVTNLEIADPKFGAGTNDGAPCERMRIIVKATEPSFFGGVVGNTGFSATRSATIKASVEESKRTPALWLLDPTGCTSLGVTGGSHVTVGSNLVPGLIAIDSDGTDSSCNGSKHTISTGGSASTVYARSTSTDPGTISLFALPTGATTCLTTPPPGSKACDPNDVSTGGVRPQPQPSGDRATRAPVDWKFNCKSSYLNFHGIAISGCPNAGTTPAYIDLLRAAIGNSGSLVPYGYNRWTSTYGSCNAPAGTVVLNGNWWVDCPTPNGLTIGNNSSVTFADGNVVFDGGIKMTGGALNINTGNLTANLSSMCLPPTVTTPCTSAASAAAGIVYLRNGDLNLTGGALSINHAVVYVNPTGVVKITGGAPPTWTAPTEGPFAGLALWAEAQDDFNINGGSGPTFSGTFFTPQAALSLAGNGIWAQPQSAQFISYQLTVTGGATFTMSPDPYVSVNLPPKAGILIR